MNHLIIKKFTGVNPLHSWLCSKRRGHYNTSQYYIISEGVIQSPLFCIRCTCHPEDEVVACQRLVCECIGRNIKELCLCRWCLLSKMPASCESKIFVKKKAI